MWTKLTELLLFGYLSLTRSFAYLGLPTLLVPLNLPPVPLYVGELSLAAFLALKPGTGLGRWMKGIAARSPLSAVSWSLYTLLAYGIYETLRGIFLGYPAITALQNFAFNYYPLYFFLGLWVGERRPDFLPNFVRAYAWWNGIYGIAWMLVLHNFTAVMPGTEVPLFGQPAGSALALVGLLCYERRLTKAWMPLLLNTFVLLGVQVRAEWVGFVAALLLWGWGAKRLSRVLAGVGAVLVLLLLGSLLDITLPSPRGEIATREIVARGIAPVNQELASQYTEDADVYAGTVSWRTQWWSAIWREVHDDPTSAVLGLGYGYPLAALSFQVPYEIRTPHNVLFYALGYSGWLGVAFFFSFQLALATLLWRARRASGQFFGLAVLVMGLAISFFGNFFETPFGAIPFYLLVGIAAAPAVSRTHTEAPPGP